MQASLLHTGISPGTRYLFTKPQARRWWLCFVSEKQHTLLHHIAAGTQRRRSRTFLPLTLLIRGFYVLVDNQQHYWTSFVNNNVTDHNISWKRPSCLLILCRDHQGDMPGSVYAPLRPLPPTEPRPQNPRALTRVSQTPPASPCCHPTEKPPSAFLRGGDFWEKTKAWASPCGKKTPQNSRRYYYHSFSQKSHHIVLPKLARNCCRAGSQARAVPHMLSLPLRRLHHVLPSSSSSSPARTLFKA